MEKDSEESCADIELSVPRQVSAACTESSVFYNGRVESGSAVIEDQAEDGPVATTIERAVTPCNTALAPQACTCVGCTDYCKPNQPLEAVQSKLTQTHASKVK